MTPEQTARANALTAEPSRDAAGDPARLARVERTRTEMMAQGSAIARTLAAEAPAIERLAAALRERGVARVVVAGCGDSWHVGAGVRHAFESLLGIPLEAAQALDYASYGVAAADARTLVIGISASGTTPVIMDALERARMRGAFTLGVSNTPGSALLTAFDDGLVVHATRSGWPTQSSTATMALLMRLAQRWADTPEAERFGADLDAIASRLDGLAIALDAPVAALATTVADAPLVLFAGLGPNMATACFGAAKVKELSPVHAIATPLEEYHHYRSQKAGEPLVLVATDAASLERALDTALVSRKVGGRLIAILALAHAAIEELAFGVVQVPAVRPELAALPAGIPMHLFAYHFAKQRDALGLGAA
ncbi:hypothetical protein GCM10007036_19650 [Alsobacter metallidurans]|uniref:Glutamine--fructose-6-phosphate aminotransferase [isomerizing] n=1 Tax=Alsobacter metallidurans TaxID=340221 RepID=A0A917I700_9HYPH|nr:SIS domain-containing protein [Alsobacter metallidurans]GGH17862.1 hypothetical protein GCM10007036_19650 [Alsobacter metallidurans]